MRKALIFKFLILIPLFFYRYSVGADNSSFLGIKGDTYLMIFCLVSLIVSGIEIFAYLKSKSAGVLNVADTLESGVVFLFNLIVVIYGIYVFVTEGKHIFLYISIIYTIQCIFWAVVFIRKYGKGQSPPE